VKLCKPYQLLTDTRGLFRGIVNFGSWEEMNYIETKGGEVRGGHYHKETRELFFIIDGEIEIDVSNIAGSSMERHIVKKGDIFIVEPFEVHTFRCLTDSRWINVLSKRMDELEQDFHRPE
jgi:mannose-6-phosphate isomerase-like protein (cupin superfamily)